MGGGSFAGIEIPSFDDVADLAANIATYGAVGYQGDGQFGAGISARAAQSALKDTGQALKEVTGAAAQEEALRMQRDALNQAKLDAEQNRKNEIERRRQQDLAASNAAAGVVGNRMNTGFYTPTQFSETSSDNLLGV